MAHTAAMSALAMTGLACFGAATAIGLVASSTVPTVAVRRGAPSIRGLAIILMAFCEGIAVLGIVVGLLAIDSGLVQDPSSGILAAGAAIVGALVGIGLILANWGRSDRSVAVPGILFVAGLAMLGIVIAVLADVIDRIGTGSVAGWPFAVLGTASALAALAIGVTGTAAIRSMIGKDEADMKAIVAAQISRCALFQMVGVGASVIAILLVFRA